MGEPDRFDRANRLFSDALELAAEERDRFVRRECGTDGALCESVLKLLSRFNRLGDFLEKPAGGVDTRVDLAPGDILDGRIRILELHGRGGMGEVYRAEDMRLGEPVAIKIVRAEWRSDAGMLARFHDEIRLARRVSHPNVCRVHGIVSAENRGRELLCLEMEYLAGDSLAAVLASYGKLDAGEALRIAEGVAAGLDAAHREGVVHRDLKPGNIILAHDRRGGERPVITDFGLARGEESGDGSWTQSGVIAGSPDYMAPEQFAGDKVTAAADIFALGVIMYEMAAGRRPYPSESIVRAAVRRLTENPQPLSRVAPELPRHWERVLARAMARDPARRYPTAGGLASDLRERPSLASAVLAGIRAPRVSRRAWLTATGVAGAAAVSSFYAISRLHYRALPDAPLIMLMPLTSSASPGNAAALSLQIEKGLQQSAHVRVLDAGRMREAWKLMGHATTLPAALTTRDAREIALREGAQFVLFGSLEKVADGWAAPLELQLLGNAPDYPKEKYPQSFAADSDQGLLTAAARAVAWIRRTAGESAEVVNARSRAPEAITTKSWAALQEYMQAETAWRGREMEGRWIEDQAAAAELHLNQALELDPNFALATTRLADIQMASGQTDRAFATYERAVQLLDSANATDKESFETRALFALDTGQFAKGGEICARYALAYPRDARPPYLEATCVEHLGDRVAALHLVERAIERDPKVYAPQVNRAIYLLWLGRFGEAESQLEKAARIYDHDWTDHVNAALAFARRDMPGVWRNLERMRNAGTMEYRSRAYMLEACLHAEQAQLGAAESLLKQGLEFDRENSQPNETIFTKLRALAMVYIHRGRMRDAVDCCEQILAAKPGRGAVLDTGIVLARAGELDAARRCIPDELPEDPPAEPPAALPASVPRELMEWPYYWRRILLLWGEMALQQGDARRAFRLIASAPLPNPSMQWPDQLVRASVLCGERETAQRALRLLVANPAAYWMSADFDAPGFIREALLMAQRFDDSLGDWASWKHFLDTKS